MMFFPERFSFARAMELLGLIGDNSDVEDLSDIDDPVGDAEYFDALRTISCNQDVLVQNLEIPCHHQKVHTRQILQAQAITQSAH